MFFELRTYDLKPGKAPVYLEFFRTFGLGRVTRHLPMMGYWNVESGRLNRIEHLWAYESWEEREAARAGLVGDAEWMTGFVPEAFKDVVAQENRIMHLEQSSRAFDAAIATRKDRHENEAKGSAMFAPSLMALTISQNPIVSGNLVAAFRVVSGVEPGRAVTLNSGEFATLVQGNSGAQTHEILRPLSLSPLR